MLNPKKLTKKEITFSRLKRRFLKNIWLARALLILGIIAAGFLFFSFSRYISLKLGLPTYTRVLSNFILTPKSGIKEISGRTNILVMGKGGAGHDAPDLTDTIMFVSVPSDNRPLSIISLPRDIWIPALRAKLNSTYYWGNQKEDGGGIVLAKSTVEEIVGQTIQYAVIIDFSGFKNIIDAIGGVEVNVEQAFIDEKYPIAGKENDPCGGDPEYKCRYETIEFKKGLQSMDGESALKFVRSRNAEGDEGTDLAREARQEKVIQAIKNKVLSADVLFSPKRMKALIGAVRTSTETDMDIDVAAILARRVLEDRENVKSNVLGEEFLLNPPISAKYDSLYVFIPKAGNWNEVHNWVDDLLKN